MASGGGLLRRPIHSLTTASYQRAPGDKSSRLAIILVLFSCSTAAPHCRLRERGRRRGGEIGAVCATRIAGAQFSLLPPSFLADTSPHADASVGCGGCPCVRRRELFLRGG